MVASHAAGTDAAERGVTVCNLYDAVVDAGTAGGVAGDKLLCKGGVSGEDVEGERGSGDQVVQVGGCPPGDYGQYGAECFDAGYGVAGCCGKEDGDEFPVAGVLHAALSEDAARGAVAEEAVVFSGCDDFSVVVRAAGFSP